jgi:hypothetical protein
MIVNIDRALLISQKSFLNLIFKQKHFTTMNNNSRLLFKSIYHLNKVDRVVLIICIILAIINSHYLFFLDLVYVDETNEANKSFTLKLNEHHYNESKKEFVYNSSINSISPFLSSKQIEGK